MNCWPSCHQCPGNFHNIISLSHSCPHLTILGPDSVGHIHYMCVSFGPLIRRCQDGLGMEETYLWKITAKNKGRIKHLVGKVFRV